MSDSLRLCGLNLPGSSDHGIFQARILSGLPFPSPGNLLNPWIGPESPELQASALPSEPPGKQKSVKKRVVKEDEKKKRHVHSSRAGASSVNETSLAPSYHGYFSFEVQFPPSLISW